MKKIYLLLTMLLMLVGASPTWADGRALPYSYGFEDYNLDTDGWTKYFGTNLTKNNNECAIVGDAKKTGSYGFRFSSYQTSGANAQYLISPELNGANGVNVSFYYKSSNTGTYGTESFKVGYSTTDTDVNSFTWGEENTTNAASWLLYEESFPAGTKYVAIYYYSNYKYRLYVDDFSFTAPANGPALAVADGSTTINSGYNYNFGLAEAGTVHYFTLSNPGTEAITLNIEATNGFSVSNTNLTIDAKASVLLHVLMADATATGTVTITPTAAGIDPFVINVSGTVADPNKVFETLLTGSIPEGWTSSGTWTWSTTNGASNTAYYESYNYRIITPLLTVADGETFFFDARGTYSGYQGIKFEYSADGTNWTASNTTTTLTSDWQTFAISDIPAGQYYIALHGWQCNIRNFYGGELYIPDGANFEINTDGTTQSLGVAAIGGTLEKTFTITNSGNANLEVTFTPSEGVSIPNYITFTDALNWGNIHMYYWDNGPDWPGVAMTEIGENEYGQKQYRAVVPDGVNGIIFNGNGKQTVDITSYTACTEGYYATDSQDGMGHYEVGSWNNGPGWNVEAGKTRDFTVVMNTETAGAKSGNVVLTFDALNATSFTIPVSGVVMPDGATVVDFNDNQLPENWTSTGTWNFANGEAGAGSAATMTTPAVEVSDGDFLVLKVRNYGNWNDDYVQVEAYDGSSWSIVQKIMSTEFYSSTEYTSLVVTGIPTTTQKLRFTAYYAYIDEIVGINFASVPVLKMTSDAEGNTELAANTTCDLGWVAADASYTYYIKNAGTATLNISEITAPTGITATTAGNATTVDPGTTLALTVAMAAENNFGAHIGTVAITTDGGNYEIPVSGVVIEDGKLYLDFSANGTTFPAGWSTGNWNITGGKAVASGDLQTTKLNAAAGEHMLIEAISTGSYYSQASLSYTITSASDNSTLAGPTSVEDQLNTSTYTIIDLGEIDPDEATDVLVKFTGSNVSVRRIYGFTPVAVAVMETTATNIAFGMQTAESAEQTFTISNVGEAELTGLSVTLGKTDAEAEYAIRMTKDDAEFTGTTLAKDETVTVYVKQLFDLNNLGAKSDVLTIAADGQTAVTINLTGTTRDGSTLYADFDEAGVFPEGWQVGANWNVSYGTANQTSTSTLSSLVTTPVIVADGDKLSFKVARYNSQNAGSRELDVRYTTDGGLTWNTYDWSNYEWSATETLREQITTSLNTFEVVGIPAGTAAFEFNGKYIKLDDITADYTVTSAPLVEFNTVSDNISNANLSADATATYTLANKGNADYVGTVTATNVTVAVEGEDVTFESNTLTIPAGKTATITAKMAFAAPYGDKSGSLGITSESWVGGIEMNYNATLVDPTDFVEDFAANAKPAGWYSENWTYSDGNAHVYAGVAKPMITEKIGAEEGKNTLTFDAKAYYGSDEQTLSVYTSTDRKTWSEAQQFTLTAESQNFSLTALADGEYYVKFEAANAVVDNLAGVKKLEAPAHDLFEVSHTMAATGTPGASYTATVVGVSLRADETVNAELWLKKGDEYTKVAELTEQAMTVNTNKTFTLTGNLPAEEGEYKMWVTVKNSDNSAYFNTDEIDFTLAHTHTMSITAFPNAAAVQADDNNEFAATFFVTVQNTGSAAIAAENVSVSLIDNADAEHVITTAWTAENSNVLYMNTKAGDNDIATDCTLKAWCWNTAEDGEWIAFTNINEGFWSLNLNGKTNFKVCRFNPAGTDENPWNNVWNQSGDLTLAGGNLIKFNGYDNGALTFTAESMAYLDPTMTTTLKVAVTGTLTDGENASFAFKAKENLSDTFYGNGLTSNVNITAASVIVLDEAEGTIASTGQNRKVQLVRKFVAGWNTICLPFETPVTTFGTEATAYAFKAYNAGLQFESAATLEAGKPYLIHVPAANDGSTPFELSGVTVSNTLTPATDNGASFIGTFEPKTAGSLTGKYGVTKTGKIQKAGEGASMKGFRAYFELLNDAKVSIIITDADGNTTNLDDYATGINRLFNDGTLNPDEPIYNTQGQQVSKSYRGVVIQNGKKFVIK